VGAVAFILQPLFRVRDRQIVQPTAVEFLAPTPAPSVTLVVATQTGSPLSG
jgi:hypothetical protein